MQNFPNFQSALDATKMERSGSLEGASMSERYESSAHGILRAKRANGSAVVLAVAFRRLRANAITKNRKSYSKNKLSKNCFKNNYFNE